ncbi:MAG: L-2-amino-thiazoline-4-carboxylic acid hydrolase [Heliobacteriaceae bacterium]|nr:L-2-amino-thiazoline-4-carboxylic acid hydrolase [Heliobacteriaceae bacterium]
MEMEKRMKVLQGMYAGVLADTVLRMGREGILEKVTAEKRTEQMQNGRMRAAQLGITKPQEVFGVLSEIFGCANWKITDTDNGFKAEATGCMLCSLAKRMGTQTPCKIYCLDPMEAMVKGIENNANYMVHETLWEGHKCHVEVNMEK